MPRLRSDKTGGFTLIEVVAVVVIIAILVVLLLPVVEKVRLRTDATRCIANLRALHVATGLYVQDKGTWPQVRMEGANQAQFARDWIAALDPYGPKQSSWICPTMQRLLGGPNLGDPENVRIDYVATAFDDRPQSPFQYANQPWFAEVGDVHGRGNLLIFANGVVRPLKDVLESPGTAPR